MADLINGCTYGLKNSNASYNNITPLYVKLTDSSLKALEIFHNNKASQKDSAIIRFDDDTGVIRVPNTDGQGQSRHRRFKFLLADMTGDSTGAVEVACQEKRSNSLVTLGGMNQKLTVKATDDVFEKTREQVKQAEEESRKNIAKELKADETKNGKHHKSSRHNFHHNSKHQRNSSAHGSSRPASSSTTAAKTHSNKPPESTTSSSTNSSIDSKKTSAVVVSQGGQGRASPNPEVFHMPYRDRIIHLLALRSYKKPELVLRLQRDGVREKDKSTLGAILSTVAHFKNNAYSLQRQFYNDVRSDWPGYSVADRTTLAKRQAEMSPMHPSPAASPAYSSTSSQPSPSSSQKRPPVTERDAADYAPASKKQRVSRVPKAAAASAAQVSPPRQAAPAGGPGSNSSDCGGANNYTGSSHGSSSSMQLKPVQSVAPQQRRPPSPPCQPAKADYTLDTAEDLKDYESHYKTIKSSDQRRQYKSDFQRQYDEYRALHAAIETMTCDFRRLEEKLNSKTPGTADYEETKRTILEQYHAVKKDPTYTDQRKRCDFLHRKLSHIKQLITTYDQESSAS